MLYEGQQANGVKVYNSVRERYDGMKRNPFDEPECGHHYARAMAAWAAVLAMTGFHFSAVTRTMRFAARPGRHFWSNGTAWGTCAQRAGARGMSLKLSVLGGQVSLDQIGLTGQGDAILDARAELKAGDVLNVRI